MLDLDDVGAGGTLVSMHATDDGVQESFIALQQSFGETGIWTSRGPTRVSWKTTVWCCISHM